MHGPGPKRRLENAVENCRAKIKQWQKANYTNHPFFLSLLPKHGAFWLYCSHVVAVAILKDALMPPDTLAVSVSRWAPRSIHSYVRPSSSMAETMQGGSLEHCPCREKAVTGHKQMLLLVSMKYNHSKT